MNQQTTKTSTSGCEVEMKVPTLNTFLADQRDTNHEVAKLLSDFETELRKIIHIDYEPKKVNDIPTKEFSEYCVYTKIQLNQEESQANWSKLNRLFYYLKESI